MHTKLEYILKMILKDAVYQAMSPPNGLFAEQEDPYPDFFFFQRGKTHFQTWVLNSVPGFLQHEGAVAS